MNPDFPQMVNDILREKNMSQSALAAQLGVAQCSVNRLARGEQTDPKWSIGQHIIALHKKLKSR